MFLNSADFGAVMQKYQPWQAGDRVIYFPLKWAGVFIAR